VCHSSIISQAIVKELKMPVELRSKVKINSISPLYKVLGIPGIYEVLSYPNVEKDLFLVVLDSGKFECVDNETQSLFQPSDEWIATHSFCRIRAVMTRDGQRRRIVLLD